MSSCCPGRLLARRANPKAASPRRLLRRAGWVDAEALLVYAQASQSIGGCDGRKGLKMSYTSQPAGSERPAACGCDLSARCRGIGEVS